MSDTEQITVQLTPEEATPDRIAQETAAGREVVIVDPSVEAETDPFNQDTDGDGLSDIEEEFLFGTDPLVADTDGDGLDDGAEFELGSSPFRADTDGDGVSDGAEVAAGADPTLIDTDGDGLTDAVEISNLGTDPAAADSDGDGLTDPEELGIGTSPVRSDTDRDGIADGAELDTDPLQADTDGDGIVDGIELEIGSDPSVNDTDGDGVDDATEFELSSDPAAADTDGDGLTDRAEVVLGTDPLVADSDGDGVDDFDEVFVDGTDPAVDDRPVVNADGDGASPDQGDEAENIEPVFNPFVEAAEPEGGFNQLTDFAPPGSAEALIGTVEATPDAPATFSDILPNPEGAGEQIPVEDVLNDASPETDQAPASDMGIVPGETGEDGPQLVRQEPEAPVAEESTFTDTPPPPGDEEFTLTTGPMAPSGDSEFTLTGGPGGSGEGSPLLGASQAESDGDSGDGDASDPSGIVLDASGADGTVQTFDADDGSIPDSDGDRVPDVVEDLLGTDPKNRDTDGDGWIDGIDEFPLDPTRDHDPDRYPELDSDGDGLTNAAEKVLGTDPLDADSDDDGLSDSFEIDDGLDPLNPDTDHDGLDDGLELDLALNPHLIRSGPERDGDVDSDGDGISNIAEVRLGTDPGNPDTDGDGITDPEERSFGTDPTNPDSDGDGLKDGAERAAGTDPRDRDSDDDGIHDGADRLPLDSRTFDLDGDGFFDEEEVRRGTDEADPNDHPGKLDLDGDGFSDDEELAARTDPADPASVPGRPGSSEEEPPGFEEGDGEGEDEFSAVQDVDGDGIPDVLDPSIDGTDQLGGDSDGDGVPSALDPDELDLERAAPAVEGADIDPSRLLRGEQADPPSGGGDPLSPPTPPGGAGTTSPIGKPVDPDEVAAEVGSRPPGDTSTDQTVGSPDTGEPVSVGVADPIIDQFDPATALDDPTGAGRAGGDDGGSAAGTSSGSTDDDIDLVIDEPVITGAQPENEDFDIELEIGEGVITDGGFSDDDPNDDNGEEAAAESDQGTSDGVGTSVDPDGGGTSGREEAEEVERELGAPTGGPQRPIDPNPQDETPTPSRDVDMPSSDDLAQPVFEGVTAGGVPSAPPRTDPRTTTIDPSEQDDVTPVTDGLRDDEPVPVIDRDQESSGEGGLPEPDLGPGPAVEPNVPIGRLQPGTHLTTGDPVGAAPPPQPDSEFEPVALGTALTAEPVDGDGTSEDPSSAEDDGTDVFVGIEESIEDRNGDSADDGARRGPDEADMGGPFDSSARIVETTVPSGFGEGSGDREPLRGGADDLEEKPADEASANLAVVDEAPIDLTVVDDQPSVDPLRAPDLGLDPEPEPIDLTRDLVKEQAAVEDTGPPLQEFFDG